MDNMSTGKKLFTKWIPAALEYALLAVTGIYLIWQFSLQTTFFLPWPGWLDDALLKAVAGVALLRAVTVGPRKPELWLSLGLAGIYYMVFRSDGYRFLLYTAALTVGMVGIDYRKVLNTFLLTVGTFFLVTIVAGITGTITNLIYTDVGRGLRSAWGICYPTDFAAIALFLAMFLWVAWRGLPDWGGLSVCAASLLLSRVIAQSNTSFACGLLFLAAILYRWFEREVVEKRGRLKGVRRMGDALVTALFPVLAAAFFILMALYAQKLNLGKKLDILMHSRLQLAMDAVELHGLKAFGTPFDLIGNGLSTFSRGEGYNFIDSSYPLILIRYGWALLAALCLSWIWTVRKALRCGERRLALVMGIIAVHSFAEHHFIEVWFNILLVLPFAAYGVAQRDEASGKAARTREEKARRNDKTAGWVPAGAITAVLALTAGYLAMPGLLSWIKTVFELKGYGAGQSGWTVILILAAAVAVIGLGLWSLCGLIRCLLRRERPTKRGLVMLAACIALGTTGALLGNGVVNAGLRDNAEALDADSAALEVILDAAEGGVYSGTMPAVYARRFPGVRSSAYAGEELARLRGSTVLMPAGAEYNAFINSDCQFAEISDRHAVYTDDAAVIDALSDAGYHMTGYYSRVNPVNLAYEASLNGLSYSEETGLQLAGWGQSLYLGPYDALRAGKYTVTFELRLREDMPPVADPVCTLEVSTTWGQNVLVLRDVMIDEFDGDGRLTVSIPFSIGDSLGVEFKAVANPDGGLRVTNIEYGRTPDFDMHRFYNDKLQLIREECYATDGTPLLQSGGYFGYTQEFDGDGNVTVRRFYGTDGNPIYRTDGYAEVHWQYNNIKQVIREEFYGKNGEPITLSSGQHANEREYDRAGNVAVYRYYDLDDEPTRISSGYAELHRAYNDDRRMIREEYFGTDGSPIALSGGYTGMEQEYDEAGNVAVRRFTVDGAPALRTDGYAEVHWQYNERKQVTREAFFGTSGEPVALSNGQHANEREYDGAGNAVVYRYYDTEDAPVNLTSGYAELHRAYNDKRQMIREAYYGADGSPAVQLAGYSSYEQTFDAAGNVADRRFLHDGAPVLRTDGYAEVKWKYNEKRQIVREEFYGTDGEPIILPDGQFANEREYDGEGNVIEYRYYDKDGVLTITTSSYAILKREYNEKKYITEERYYGTDGNPVLSTSGYAGVHREYNDRNLVVREDYFLEDGKPGSVNGYASVQREYNATNQVVTERFFDENGAPAIVGSGYSQITYEYNGFNQLMLVYFLDLEGNPIKAGGAYFHEYLSTLMGKGYTVFISIKDEGTNSLTVTLLDDLKALGLKTNLSGRYRNSYYAVITPDGVWEEISDKREVSMSGTAGSAAFEIASAGYLVGNRSSIVIDGVEYSKNVRGMNIVVYDADAGQVVDSIAFDTCDKAMKVTE